MESTELSALLCNDAKKPHKNMPAMTKGNQQHHLATICVTAATLQQRADVPEMFANNSAV
jgi:hypothetical protein